MKIKPGLRFCDICLVTGKVNLAIYKAWNASGVKEVMIDACDAHKDFIRDLSASDLASKMKDFIEKEQKPFDESLLIEAIKENSKPNGVLEN